jgi:hypothetical protein
MRQSFRRAGLLAMAVLLALVGTVSLAGTASAAAQPHTLLSNAQVQGCGFPSECPLDPRVNPAGTLATSFCVFDIYHLVYTPAGRGGFVNRSLLSDPGRQTAACVSTGTPVRVRSTAGQDVTDLRACNSDNCVNFGTVARQDRGGAWCHLPPDRVEWVLVYMNNIGRAGFIAASALEGGFSVPSCS